MRGLKASGGLANREVANRWVYVGMRGLYRHDLAMAEHA